MIKLVVIILAAITLSGCAGQSSRVSPQVSKRIEERTGHGLKPDSKDSSFAIPPGLSLADGLSEDEAVAIALWNNAAFQADLTALGLARADLIEAGQLRNPMLTLLLPWGPKQLEATANLPLELFWQRPRRVAVAEIDLERVGESLVQTGLNLVRDVRVAHAELMLANDRALIADESLRQRAEIARIVEARLRAGDISELETSDARLDLQQSDEQAARFQNEALVARDRLRFLLGMASREPSFDPTASLQDSPLLASSRVSSAGFGLVSSVQQIFSADLNDLISQALAARPDLRASELAIEAAGKRAKWERAKIFSISAILDANAQGKNGFEAGPGLQAELPVFNRNRGGISRAEAEIERAARQYLAVRQRIVLEVEEAYRQLLGARQSLDSWRGQIIPQIEREIRISERAYAAGEVPYLFVLEKSLRLTDARLRESEERAALLRATARLERAVGKKINERP